MRWVGGAGIVGARREINMLPALPTYMLPVEFIGENLYFRTAILAFTEK
jgi:hypothetical protein